MSFFNTRAVAGSRAGTFYIYGVYFDKSQSSEPEDKHIFHRFQFEYNIFSPGFTTSLTLHFSFNICRFISKFKLSKSEDNRVMMEIKVQSPAR